MPHLATKQKCTGCMACIDSCPQSALSYELDGEGFYSIFLDEKLCIECGHCERSCPVLSILPEREFKNFIAYAAWSPNDEIRLQSASGGVFAECALAVLKKDGVVIGAAIRGKSVGHIAITNIDDLHKLQNSKYIQSKTKGIFETTKQFLKQGKTVLFSGTPCQIAGLKTFMGKISYSGHLVTAQVVCHGVPSGHIIQLFERIQKEKIKNIISFRAKVNGWMNSHVLTYTDANHKTKTLPANINTFIKLYGTDLLLRRSCYDCRFCSLRGLADISLADYWGNRRYPEEHLKGVSLVIVHSKEGEELVRGSDLIIHQTTWEEALPANPRIISGKNWLYHHPARRFLKFHLNYLSGKMLEKVFANTIGKYDVILYPYKVINKSLHVLNSLTNKKALSRVLKKWQAPQKK